MSSNSSTMRMPSGMLIARRMLPIATRLGLTKPLLRLLFRRMRASGPKRKAFAGYRPTAQDVFVATFGKSGTNWMMQIAQQITHRGEAEFEHIHDVVPWPDAPMPLPLSLTDTPSGEPPPTGLRVIKTHLETEFVPYDEQATYLTIVRDPKEVLVSSYHFLLGLIGALPYVSIDEWFELAMKPDSLAGSWAVHTASFWSWRDRPNALVFTYSEVIEKPRECIARVADVMGVKLTTAELTNVVERSSFDYMKQHESLFAPPSPAGVNDDQKTLMVRRGKTGGSDELLSREQQAAVDRLCRGELHRPGSDFPYDELFEVVEHDPES